jgi:hypothetical protein
MVPGGAIVSGTVVMQDSQTPGYAVVGDPRSGEEAPGYAAVGGPGSLGDPAPIGIARGGQNLWVDPRMAAAGPRPGAGPYDPAVMPSSLIPPQSAMSGPGHDRPHVLSHLFGLPRFGRHWEEREAKRREQHASIAYDQPNQVVGELPASVVYGKNPH